MGHYLVLKVNGVRIAARGGSWGMDDSRKRVSREKLEPYFRLHREANVNIIRNWMGQNTEETFFELADEYGMMVWNDFWASTQDYNTEPLDIPLFLDNARDTVLRFRNHPSIVMWCGRNEGVPSPILNEGLIDVTQQVRRHALLLAELEPGEPAEQRPVQVSRTRRCTSRCGTTASRWRRGRCRCRRWSRWRRGFRRKTSGRLAMRGRITTGTRAGTARLSRS